MKQFQIIKACKAIDKILRLDIPFPVKNRIYKLRRTFQAEWEFQVEQEQLLVDSLKRKKDENGKEYLPESEINRFNQKAAEIGNMAVNVDYEPVRIEVSKVMEKPLSVLDDDDFRSLDGFIEFE